MPILSNNPVMACSASRTTLYGAQRRWGPSREDVLTQGSLDDHFVT